VVCYEYTNFGRRAAMPKVTVYYFMGFDINSRENIRSKEMATLDWISKHPPTEHPYVALMETAKEVETSELNANGLYQEPREK
jgi:hypothetical protein